MKTKFHMHTQSTASSTWSVSHNLGCKPVVEVTVDIDGARAKIYPQKVLHVTDNLMQISFSTPRTGAARLVGTSPTP